MPLVIKKVAAIEVAVYMRKIDDRNIPMTNDFCLMNRGVYTALPVVWNEPPCVITENKCFFQGDDYCEYQIKWKRQPSLKSLLLRLVAPWRLAKATIDELEKYISGAYEI